jgi:hypothetical protein
VADSNFRKIVLGQLLSTVFDVEGAQHCLQNPACAASHKEFNPIVGRTRGRQYAAKLSIQFATSVVPLYFLKRMDMKEKAEKGLKSVEGPWWFWGNVWTGTNLITGAMNWSRKAPASFCPSGTVCKK